MPSPITATTDEDDLLLRFLKAAEHRAGGRDCPFNRKESMTAIAWLRGLVGRLNEDGTVGEQQAERV
jgi:hypothetical protein